MGSDANATYVAFQRETAWGVLPVPVALKKMRFTRETLSHAKQTVQSAEIRDDRQIGDLPQVGVSAEGTVDFEFSNDDFDAFLEGAMFNAFAAGILVNGKTESSYLLEKRLAASAFQSFAGMMVNEFTLDITARQIITGSVGFIGRAGLVGADSLDGGGEAGVEAQGSGRIFTASANVANITQGGVPLATGVRRIGLSIANNLRANDVVGKLATDDVGVGECTITGSVEVYFKDKNLLQMFQDHAETSLGFRVAYVDGATITGYDFTLPRVRFSQGNANVTGKNTDLMQTLEWQALANPGQNLLSIAKIAIPA